MKNSIKKLYFDTWTLQKLLVTLHKLAKSPLGFCLRDK